MEKGREDQVYMAWRSPQREHKSAERFWQTASWEVDFAGTQPLN